MNEFVVICVGGESIYGDVFADEFHSVLNSSIEVWLQWRILEHLILMEVSFLLLLIVVIGLIENIPFSER
jgi:hypothetical protein